MSPDDRPLTVLECSGVGPGGITRVLTELARHWPADHRLEVLAAPAGWDVGGVPVVSRQGGGRERTIAAAAAALRRRRAGRVLSLSPSLAVAGVRVPLTTIVHDLAFRLWPHGLSRAVRQYRRVSYATAIRRSGRLLCVSERTRHDLLGVYGLGADRTAVWHPGSDLSAPGARPAVLPPDYVLVPGHAAHKGVELAVEAMRDFPGHTLAVLGGGARPAAGGSGRVIVLDRLDEAAYAAAVAGAAAFVMPSHFEGYGLPAAEALRLGTPTVISPDPALREATGGAAVCMESWTAGALTAALREALARPRPARPVATRSWREATLDLVERVWR
ncbi:glycosyltransferase [Mangrovihabitans endophyticus]|uniref:Uncharacterized protein n=1 Tax=Mangrovihabitans endophyticus TaxID=1751298 RepID=A0A8J3C8X8_9ACTN|nr:glycosyltransferase [Mangrovihabitans endophyticus]GGL19543.1 hypothetical protein GCM10012284_62610 [Mangrovihabitans endophyticus]